MDVTVRTQLDHFPHQLTWIASVATALLCAVVTAAFMAWMPTAIGDPKDHATLAESSPMPAQPSSATADRAWAGVASGTPTRTPCAECGVIESLRQIDTHGEYSAESTKGYEFTIRFRDGSRRVYTEATPRAWRLGSQVRVID
jgi:hypothetical protein